MENNVQVLTIPNPDGSTYEAVIIDNGEGSFTSMTKEAYLASLNTPPQEPTA
jgi:hypothetical protein